MSGLWALAAGSFAVGFSGAVMPGTVMAVTIGHALRQGALAGLWVAVGHSLLEAGTVGVLAAGAGAWLARPLVIGLVGAVGSATLLLMGVAMLRSLPGLTLDLTASRPPSAAGPMRDGFLFSLGNPYFWLWWVTVGASLLAVAMDAEGTWAGGTAFYLGHIASDIPWYAFLGCVVARGRRFLTNRAYRGLVGGCALLLLLFAALFGYLAWERLAG